MQKYVLDKKDGSHMVCKYNEPPKYLLQLLTIDFHLLFFYQMLQKQ